MQLRIRIYTHAHLLAVAAIRAFLLAFFLGAVSLPAALAAFLAGVRRLLLLDGAAVAAGGLGAQDDVHALHVVGAVRLVLAHLGSVEEEDLALLLDLHLGVRSRLHLLALPHVGARSAAGSSFADDRTSCLLCSCKRGRIRTSDGDGSEGETENGEWAVAALCVNRRR